MYKKSLYNVILKDLYFFSYRKILYKIKEIKKKKNLDKCFSRVLRELAEVEGYTHEFFKKNERLNPYTTSFSLDSWDTQHLHIKYTTPSYIKALLIMPLVY